MTATDTLAKSDELLAIIEDDPPAPQPVVWNIDVQQETVTIIGLQTSFTDSLFTTPTQAGCLVPNNVDAANTGATVSSRDYGGTIG